MLRLKDKLGGNIENSDNSTAANKLKTPRTIQTNLSVNSSVTFDGSTDVKPGVTGTLPVTNGGTGLTTIPEGRLLIGNDTNTFKSTSLLHSYFVNSYFEKATTDTPVQEGWRRVCKIKYDATYGNCLLFLNGEWYSSAPTLAVLSLHFMPNKVFDIQLLSCLQNSVTQIRLVSISESTNTSEFWLDVYIKSLSATSETGFNRIGRRSFTFLGSIGKVEAVASTEDNPLPLFTDQIPSDAKVVTCDLRTTVDQPVITLQDNSGSNKTTQNFTHANMTMKLPETIKATLDGFIKPIKLTNEDLNNVKTPGVYEYWSSTGTIKNIPTSFNNRSFGLLVLPAGGLSNTQLNFVQILYGGNIDINKEKYTRTYTVGNSAGFTEWQKLGGSGISEVTNLPEANESNLDKMVIKDGKTYVCCYGAHIVEGKYKYVKEETRIIKDWIGTTFGNIKKFNLKDTAGADMRADSAGFNELPTIEFAPTDTSSGSYKIVFENGMAAEPETGMGSYMYEWEWRFYSSTGGSYELNERLVEIMPNTDFRMIFASMDSNLQIEGNYDYVKKDVPYTVQVINNPSNATAKKVYNIGMNYIEMTASVQEPVTEVGY